MGDAKTQLRYRRGCSEDMHAMLKAHGDWMPLGSSSVWQRAL
jgi:hypothetical protein